MWPCGDLPQRVNVDPAGSSAPRIKKRHPGVLSSLPCGWVGPRATKAVILNDSTCEASLSWEGRYRFNLAAYSQLHRYWAEYDSLFAVFDFLKNIFCLCLSNAALVVYQLRWPGNSTKPSSAEGGSRWSLHFHIHTSIWYNINHEI
jgi:hypothetical protein